MKKIHKKGGVVSELISGTGGIVLFTIIAFVIISTIMGAGLLTGTYQATAGNLTANFTKGIQNVSSKIPTILLIGAVVLLFGVIVLLVRQSQAMGIGGSRSGSL